MFIFSLIVGLIVLGLLPALYLGFNAWLQRELSVQRELGNCIATPFGFERQNFLVYRMDSVTIQCPDQSIQIHSPLLRIQLGMLDGTADVFLSIGSVRYEQLSVSDSTPADSNLTSAANYAFPRYNIPIHYKLDVGSVWARKDSLQINAWQVQLESTGSQSTGLKITSLTTNLFDHPISLQSHLNWQADSLASELFIRGGTKDSIRIVSKGHYKDIRQQSANLFVFVNDPLKWYEYTLPSPLPSLAAISLQAAIQTDTNLLNSKYQGKLQFTNSTNFPFQWSHNDLTFSGTGKQMQLGLLQTNKKTNGSISLNGTLVAQSPVQLSVTGYIDNIALFPDNPALPADLRLHSLQIQNNLLTIQATTLAGSDVFLKINLGSQSPFLQAQGDLAPHEPWVTWWTKGNVQPASRIAAQVTYDKNIWNGELQTSIQNAYGARADSFYAVVQITDSQVLIPLAQIHNQNTLYTVNGSVNISNPAPVIQFTAQEAQTGIVQLFLIPDQSISVSASNINLSALPIQDTLLPDFVNGILSANFTHSFLDTMGHFVFSLQHQYQNYPVTLQGDVYIAGDSAHVQELLVERNNNSLTATADFKPIFTNPGLHSLQNANINIKHIDLPLIGSALLDSLFTSGSLYGTIVYNRLSGFNSQIRGENISFKQLDSTFMNIPRLHLDAVANKAMLNARLKLGALGEWDSEIALNFLNPMDSTRSVSGAIVTDHGGVILLNAPSQKIYNKRFLFLQRVPFYFLVAMGKFPNQIYKSI
jgi:hypothetical protein